MLRRAATGRSILYFHGNGGALRYRVERFRKLIRDGVGLVALEYRGFGGNGGTPTEAGLIADAEAAYAFAASRYPAKQIVLWGESLGTGVAVALAAEKPVGRVILEAPFTSAAAVAASRYWYMPVRLLMKDQYRSDERIGKVTAPVLILHGARDHVVAFAMGERMFELTNAPKHIVRFLDGDHEDLDAQGALHAVGRFLAGDLDQAPGPPRPLSGACACGGYCGTVMISITWPEIVEIEAAAAAPVVELTVVETPRRAAESDLRLS